ncbi:MAG: hypothetical protein ACK4YP_28710 [Myxococcota bacterium]
MTEHPPITNEGRTWAYLSYASTFLGLPFCVVPLFQKNDAFALYHAKHATVTYILFWVLFFVYLGLSVVTCGVGSMCLPLVFVAYAPMIHGLVLVSQDKWEEPMGLVGGGERFFGSIRIEER